MQALKGQAASNLAHRVLALKLRGMWMLVTAVVTVAGYSRLWLLLVYFRRPPLFLKMIFVAAALGLGRWSVELLTIADYSGLDNASQHLSMFKLAQMVRADACFAHIPLPSLDCCIGSIRAELTLGTSAPGICPCRRKQICIPATHAKHA